MKLYRYLYIVSAVVLLFCNTACELDQIPEGGTITEEQKDKIQGADPSKLKAEITGLSSSLIKYGAISEWAGSTNHYDYGFASACMMFDASGMDVPSEYSGYNWYNNNMRLTDRTATSSFTYFLWNMFYSEIKIANDILKIAKAGSDNEILDSYRGQALGFRAWAYLNLVQIYQFTYKGHESAPAVPIVTEDMTGEETANNPRATVQAVYEFIMTDLNEAISLLTNSRDDKSQINVNVAYGLRARANLLMQNWAAAAADADKALEGYTPYTIDQVSKPTFNNSTSSAWIWGNIITETNDIVQSGILNFPSHMCSFTGNGYAPGYAGRYINSKLYDQIPDEDVRKGWWALADPVFEKGEFAGWDFTQKTPHVDWEWAILYKGEYQNIAEWEGWQAPYLNVKFGPYQDIYDNPTNACDFPLMRAEEMILIKAEGLAMSGGNGKKVLEDFVKEYRNPSYVCTASTPEEIQDEIWFQRRIELWGEGFSFFDMMRLKKPLDRTGANFPEVVAFNLPAESQIFLWLIPEDEINNNNGISPDENNPVTPVPKA
ncbi:RagB/SusD family nutrient uptake outer membrane protein [Odoribacter lunatus]|uniref:RagB/SusD family nutrient uptake outer membrane protein n=1 Tax=Odoribacter lunatus TaxID=2941335 RepID=UPI00203AD4BE|nr:RagB/SusD family nutrient uptake outer membrane protein [Odoribacter lunatus]